MTYKISDITGRANRETGQQTNATNLTELSSVHLDLLDKPIVACAATTRRGGPPHLSAVWLMRDDEFIYVNSTRGRVKDRNLRARPVLTLMLLNPENVHHWISIEGEVVNMVDEDDPENGHLATENIDALSELYLGVSPYPYRVPEDQVRVMYKVQPTRIVTFGPA